MSLMDELKVDGYKDFLVGKTIINVEATKNGDEGLILEFDDGSTIEFAFSSGYGEII